MQHCPQHLAQIESCIVCPPLKLLRATLRATVAEVESATTSATSQATVSPCVDHLQHCVQLRKAKVARNVASCVRALTTCMSRQGILYCYLKHCCCHSDLPLRSHVFGWFGLLPSIENLAV